MTGKWPGLVRRLWPGGWWVIAPTAVIAALMLLLTGGSSAATASQPRVLLTKVLFQEQQPLCQSCHPKEFADWNGTTHAQATLDPVFQEQLAKSHDQTACLACHTTGFDTGSGKFLSEGVTCEACHGPYKEGHPAKATMQLPMASDTCRMCHQQTFKEWEGSQHAQKNIECFDCHKAHTQGLRLDSAEKLCGACHSDKQTGAAHTTHNIEGVDCETCHMAPAAETAPTAPGQKPARDHSFKVGSDVCAGCHKSTIHAAASAGTQVNASFSPSQDAGVGGLAAAPIASAGSASVPASDQQTNALQQRLNSLRDVAVVSMGLALGVGGFMGLVVGVLGTTIWQKRREG